MMMTIKWPLLLGLLAYSVVVVTMFGLLYASISRQSLVRMSRDRTTDTCISLMCAFVPPLGVVFLFAVAGGWRGFKFWPGDCIRCGHVHRKHGQKTGACYASGCNCHLYWRETLVEDPLEGVEVVYTGRAIGFYKPEAREIDGRELEI